MKLTEMQLLQAIGQADEKLIERTAPKESGDAAGKPLIRMRRRTFEILAVCAAFCVFIGGGLLIRSLYQNKMQAPFSAASDDESEARDVLETFLNACKNGDREQIMELSLIETVCSIIDEDPDSAKEWAAAYRDALASVRKYKIGSCEDITAYLKESRQTEQDLCELYAYGLKEKGKYEEAEKLLGDNPMLDYYDRAEKGYAFQAWLAGSPAGDWDLFDQDGCVISVILYDGRWYVQPVEYLTPKMSEAGKEKLAQYRAADPEYRKKHPQQEDEPAQNKAEATAALEQFMQACQNGDREKIKAYSLVEPFVGAMVELYGIDTADTDRCVETYLEELASVESYQIGDCTNETEKLLRERQHEQERAELDCYILRTRGQMQEANTRMEDAMLDYYNRIDQMFTFTVTMNGEGTAPEDYFNEAGYALKVVRYDGKWYAQPVSYQSQSLPDTDRAALEQYRAQDPEYPKDKLEQAWLDYQLSPNEKDSSPEAEAARAAICAFFEVCKTGDADRIRESCLYHELRQMYYPDTEHIGEDDTIMQLEGLLRYEFDTDMFDGSSVIEEQLSRAEVYRWCDAYALDSAGRPDEAEKLLESYPLTEFWSSVSNLKSAYVKLYTCANGHERQYGLQFTTVKYQDEWRVLPFTMKRPDPEKDAFDRVLEYKKQHLPETDLSEQTAD